MCQEERLLRELLPGPSRSAHQSPQLHHSHSDEQWLVSSEIENTPTADAANSECLRERAKLQEVLQDQLSQQLQQESAEVQNLQRRLNEQQQATTILQHQLEKSHTESEQLQRLLEIQQVEMEESHQRAQLHDLLTQQLHSQLQEVIEQRDAYKQQWQQQLTPATRDHDILQVRSASSRLRGFCCLNPL